MAYHEPEPTLDAPGVEGDGGGRGFVWEEWRYCFMPSDMALADRVFVDLAYDLVNLTSGVLIQYFDRLFEEQAALRASYEFKRDHGRKGTQHEVEFTSQATGFLDFVDGTKKPRVYLRGLRQGEFARAFPPLTHHGRISLNGTWVPCIRADFDNSALSLERRVCALLDLAGVIVHETMHALWHLSEGRARSAQGYYWWRVRDTFGLFGSDATDGCKSNVAPWPCGVRVDRTGTCSWRRLRSAVDDQRYSATFNASRTLVQGTCWPQ